MPAISQAVGRKSQKALGWPLVRPGFILPGQRAMVGTRMPPSFMLRLCPLSGPELLKNCRLCPPSGEGPLYHHIGIYGFRRSALERFVNLSPGHLEQRERLEQLRALEAGMVIEVGLVDRVPFGVDTPADLERARRALDPKP